MGAEDKSFNPSRNEINKAEEIVLLLEENSKIMTQNNNKDTNQTQLPY
jgi:hypothetical protein